MEAVVIGLAIPLAIVLEHLRHGVAGGVGGGLAVCALLLSGMVGRPGMGWALWAGTVLQVLVIAAGIVVPAMYILGVIFAALWITGIWLARRLQTPAPGARAPPVPSATDDLARPRPPGRRGRLCRPRLRRAAGPAAPGARRIAGKLDGSGESSASGGGLAHAREDHLPGTR